jgi:hypothetical protein
MAKRGTTSAFAALLFILAGPLSAQQLRVLPAVGGGYGPQLRLPALEWGQEVPLASLAPSYRFVSGTVMPAAVEAGAQQRRVAIEYSDAYYTRLTIHRIGSYVMLPLFAGEYVLGKRLLDGGNVASWVRPWHGNLAAGIGVLFAVNTVTGVWNLAEGWKEPEGRTRRILHSAMMLAADAGFLYTASLAGESEGYEFGDNGGGAFGSGNNSIRHRNAALVSIGLSTVSTLMMWLWKD